MGDLGASSATVESLIFDLLEWLAGHERTYEEVMDAWRTTCPRLPVWEDTNDLELVRREYRHGRCIVKLSARGRAMLGSRSGRTLEAVTEEASDELLGVTHDRVALPIKEK